MKNASSIWRKIKDLRRGDCTELRAQLKMKKIRIPCTQELNYCEVGDQQKEEAVCKAQLKEILNDILQVCEGRKDPKKAPESAENKYTKQLIDLTEAQPFLRSVIEKLGVPKASATTIVDSMLAADYFGHRSMGLHRMPATINALLEDAVNGQALPKIIRENRAVALVSGQNAPGPVVGHYCMELAVLKAIDAGVGWVAARESNCIGMASWYACQALEYGMIGLCMSNAAPCVVPAGGLVSMLGENPLACAASATSDQLIVDMGVTMVPMQQIEMDFFNGAVTCIPDNLAFGRNGLPTASAAETLRAQRLRPFAPEHKGYGLAAVVDVLCGVLTGANYSTKILRRTDPYYDVVPAGLGQIFIAFDPLQYGYTFEDRLNEFIQDLRSAWPEKQGDPTLVPGDHEMQHMDKVDTDGGISVTPCQVALLHELANRFSLKPLNFFEKSKV